MTAYNIVRFRVKPGRDEAFLEAHRKARPNMRGALRGAMVKTGDSTYCIVAEWRRFKDIVNARPQMIGMLDSFREHLEDLGNGLGVTDPVSGDVVVNLKLAPPAKKAKAKAAKTKKSAPKKAKKAKGKKAKKAKAR